MFSLSDMLLGDSSLTMKGAAGLTEAPELPTGSTEPGAKGHTASASAQPKSGPSSGPFADKDLSEFRLDKWINLGQ